jgi:hypothetical protein
MDQPNGNFQQVPTQMQPPQALMRPATMSQPMKNSNPLAKHFRQPALYIKLTSNGTFWPEGSLDLPITNEIPVYPMTAKDEIVLRTPDALINGTSVVQVIQSCCPNIKDAWKMPSVDVDSTLIAIRMASFGSHMPITAKCPHCGEEHDYDVDLADVRGKIQPPNYNDTVQTQDGLTIKLKPLNYSQVSKAGSISFEEDRLIQSLANTDTEEAVRVAEYSKHMAKMIDINISNVADCTESIIADGQSVTDPKFIIEYYQNVDGNVIKAVQTKMKEYAEAVSIKPEDANCTACGKEFKLTIEFDYSRFFAKGF